MGTSIFDIANPFDFGRPAKSKEEFAGRSNEIQQLGRILDVAAEGRSMNVALIGDRASGKTSLLNVVESMARDRGGIVARLDLNEKVVASDIDVIVAIMDQIMEKLRLHDFFEKQNWSFYQGDQGDVRDIWT